MPRKKNDCYPDLCRFMSYTHHGDLTHYPPDTTPMFSNAALIALTLKDIVKHFNFLVCDGNPEPTQNKLPKCFRKCTVQCKKKAISSYMPHHGEWNTYNNQSWKPNMRQISSTNDCQDGQISNSESRQAFPSQTRFDNARVQADNGAP